MGKHGSSFAIKYAITIKVDSRYLEVRDSEILRDNSTSMVLLLPSNKQ